MKWWLKNIHYIPSPFQIVNKNIRDVKIMFLPQPNPDRMAVVNRWPLFTMANS